MRSRLRQLGFLGAAMLVAAGLTFASIEIPRLANGLLERTFNTYQEPTRDLEHGLDIFPGVDSGRGPRRQEVRASGRS